ncbi:hypothetical protein EW146_g1795 [Bondarzewia mesenterica]|uniref:2,5-diamino-6-ribosylamino-4(3H)-pyrimidinone 5'-phosphate reductase n=1 Tax=Bondarzewia mesenterica TaxID=1095465 RepID=A0A4S4M474_9AGAM|nr:hypothetical protein EW146_g1795 [Bondarzewia mesenterica]
MDSILDSLQASLVVDTPEAPAPGPPEFLNTVLGALPEGTKPGTSPLEALDSPDPERPYVTLTFAQSLDAKIAGKNGLQLILSGEESMKMTHWMRTMHDGIMIGIGTASNDNPQLNVRHLPFPSQNTHFRHYHHPRPLILDANLRISPKCKLITNASLGAGVPPWVITARPQKIDGFWASEGEEDTVDAWDARKATLEKAGVKLISDPDLPSANTDLPLPEVLRALRAEGIRSVMVEGGARVIQSFLSSSSSPGFVDTLVVTVAPRDRGCARHRLCRWTGAYTRAASLEDGGDGQGYRGWDESRFLNVEFVFSAGRVYDLVSISFLCVSKAENEHVMSWS